MVYVPAGQFLSTLHAAAAHLPAPSQEFDGERKQAVVCARRPEYACTVTDESQASCCSKSIKDAAQMSRSTRRSKCERRERAKLRARTSAPTEPTCAGSAALSAACKHARSAPTRSEENSKSSSKCKILYFSKRSRYLDGSKRPGGNASDTPGPSCSRQRMAQRCNPAPPGRNGVSANIACAAPSSCSSSLSHCSICEVRSCSCSSLLPPKAPDRPSSCAQAYAHDHAVDSATGTPLPNSRHAAISANVML